METQYTLQEVCNGLAEVETAILKHPTCETTGWNTPQALTEIGHQLERIAEALEQINTHLDQ
jgi:hypothetical protein